MLEAGAGNLAKHIENAKLFGIPVVVAVNSFKYDTEAEINLVQKIAVEQKHDKRHFASYLSPVILIYN